jgi:hypothetical protein
MSEDNQVTIIEVTADYLLLVILGETALINDLIYELNKNNYDENIKYICLKIDEPLANECFELSNKHNMDYIIDNGVESAQCYTYAEGYNKNLYMVVTITNLNNKYIIGYPKFNLTNEDDDPENIILNWFKKQTKKIPKGAKKNMKLVTVVGIDTDILVISTKIK